MKVNATEAILKTDNGSFSDSLLSTFFRFDANTECFLSFYAYFCTTLIVVYAKVSDNSFQTICLARNRRSTHHGVPELGLYSVAHGMALRSGASLAVLEFPCVPFLLLRHVFHACL